MSQLINQMVSLLLKQSSAIIWDKLKVLLPLESLVALLLILHMAIREGTNIVLQYNLEVTEVKSDANNVISAIHSKNSVLVDDPVILDILVNLRLLGNILRNFVLKDKNRVTHILVSFTLIIFCHSQNFKAMIFSNFKLRIMINNTLLKF
ncbi:hypothetical protein PanWU01x14_029090 [Parasponia andersonii]|uniref:Uncharacterized protein n=1 Tax=Parasponia andersonii TaxID=3476 RepID=A0A2P5DVI7_PARAD|nr:hypothetical protein PanWU01x14_029090 [Parasponia andersonii]